MVARALSLTAVSSFLATLLAFTLPACLVNEIQNTLRVCLIETRHFLCFLFPRTVKAQALQLHRVREAKRKAGRGEERKKEDGKKRTRN